MQWTNCLAGFIVLFASTSLLGANTASADWSYTSTPQPMALVQSGNTALELMCSRMRFVPAGFEDSESIVAEGGFSIRFMASLAWAAAVDTRCRASEKFTKNIKRISYYTDERLQKFASRVTNL